MPSSGGPASFPHLPPLGFLASHQAHECKVLSWVHLHVYDYERMWAASYALTASWVSFHENCLYPLSILLQNILPVSCGFTEVPFIF